VKSRTAGGGGLVQLPVSMAEFDSPPATERAGRGHPA
jgi:hypothetical protein